MHTIRKEVSPGYAAVGAAVALASRRECAAEAFELAQEVLGCNRGNAYFAGMAHLALTQVAALAGDAKAAEVNARQALVSFELMPPMQPMVFGLLCQALLLQGARAEARDAAEAGLGRLQAQDGVGWQDLSVRLAAFAAYDALDDRAAADAQLRFALGVLRTRALGIGDPTWRQSYLEKVPEHGRVLKLAQERLGVLPEGGWEGIIGPW